VPTEMPALARTGRLLVIAAFAVTILGDLIVVSFISTKAGVPPPSRSIVRLALTVALFYAIWRGANWARWLVVCLLGLALLLIPFSLQRVGVHPLLLGLGLQFLVGLGLLAFPPSVAVFLSHQRARYSENT